MRPRIASFEEQKGAVVPLLAVTMVGLLGCVALAVDIGMVAVARTQCQNTADAVAMAGARTLNGDGTSNYNIGNVSPNAVAAAAANKIAGQTVGSSQVSVSTGSYTYDYTQSKFVVNVPAASTDTPNLVQSTVTVSGQNLFAKVFGANTFNTTANATAVHRPRDVAVVLDMSGSMRFDSQLALPHSGARTSSNNPDTVYPLFGHYSSSSINYSASTEPTYTNGNSYGLSNLTVASNAGPAIVGDFYQSALGAGTPVAAFSPAPDSYATAPAGDKPLKKLGSLTAYATNVQDITGGLPFLGYTPIPYTGYFGIPILEFAGYTQGPRYWGKTFFIWPPDPRTGSDWRAKFFNYPGASSTGVDNNTMLWDSSGSWRAPSSSSYDISYSAILAWIKASPNPFPNQLRAGRILYYDAIPSTIDTSSFPPTDMNQRFWKSYIDYVLGVRQTSSSTYTVITPQTGYGDDFAWGTVAATTKPSGKYMSYTDNPERPQTHFWFGPMSMIDFLGNYNLISGSDWSYFNWPGTSHEGPGWACKLGVQAAMTDIKNNHPNDFVSLIFFNRPQYFANDASGTFNRARVPLGRNYQRLSDTLWFPPSTIDNPGTEIRIYDSGNNDVPRMSRGTTTVMGFMLAYNQLSSNSSLRSFAPSPAPAGEAGGYGRNGSQKLVILETDGMANTFATAGFTNGGARNSYYNVRAPSEFPTESGSDVPTQIYSVVSQICALDTASPPGYSTARKPVLVHCIAEGPIFNANSVDPQKSSALALLQNIQTIGSVQASAATPLESYKIITGTNAQRISLIQQAFSAIMQDGVQVSLIK